MLQAQPTDEEPDVKNVILGLFMLSSASVAAAAAESTTHVVPLSRVETISGTKVKFDGTVTYTIPAGNCEPIPLELVVNLDDLDRNLLKIVKSAKVEKNKECGDRLSLSSARLSAKGDNLMAKVAGKVGREQCVKVFGTTVKTTIDGDAGVNATFDPKIDDNVLHMTLADGPHLDVPNDVMRAVLEALDLDKKIEEKMAEGIQKALDQPKSALQLPAELAGFTFKFDDAKIGTVDKRLSLIVTGSSPRTQPLIPKFLSYLGAPAAAAACQ